MDLTNHLAKIETTGDAWEKIYNQPTFIVEGIYQSYVRSQHPNRHMVLDLCLYVLRKIADKTNDQELRTRYTSKSAA